MSNPDQPDPIDRMAESEQATAIADEQARALVTAARKIASELVMSDADRRASEERRERRELIRVVILAMSVGLPAIIGAFASIVGAMQGQQTHQLVNSRMTELLEEVGKSQRAEGVLEGKGSSGK
jgi:hypothetical protein